MTVWPAATCTGPKVPAFLFEDIVYDDALYTNQEYVLLNLNDYIVDVDEIIMNQDDLSFTIIVDQSSDSYQFNTDNRELSLIITEAIQPGLERKEFMQLLENKIEKTSESLLF